MQRIEKNINQEIKEALLFSGVSLICFVSIVFSMFAAFPLSLSIMSLGRTKGYLVIFITWVLSYGLSLINYNDASLFFAYTPVIILGVTISEILIRKEKPSNGIIKYGLLLATLLLGSITLIYFSNEQAILNELATYSKNIALEFEKQKSQLMNENSNQAYEILAFFQNTKEFTKTVLEMIPRTLFVGLFISLWANLILVLRTRKFFFDRSIYPYSEKELLNFKLSENLIWVLILFIAFAITGYELENSAFTFWGETGLWCVGVFYFFQGMGIFLDSLTFFKIYGFMRFFFIFGLIMFTPFWWAIVAGIGVFNTFFNFREKISKNKIQGD